jgi:hypothetical protein
VLSNFKHFYAIFRDFVNFLLIVVDFLLRDFTKRFFERVGGVPLVKLKGGRPPLILTYNPLWPKAES